MKLKERLQGKLVKVRNTVGKTLIKAQTTLLDTSGASAVEVALAAVIAVVLALIIINAFTGIFSNTIIPGIQDKIKSIFSVT